MTLVNNKTEGNKHRIYTNDDAAGWE